MLDFIQDHWEGIGLAAAVLTGFLFCLTVVIVGVLFGVG